MATLTKPDPGRQIVVILGVLIVRWSGADAAIRGPLGPADFRKPVGHAGGARALAGAEAVVRAGQVQRALGGTFGSGSYAQPHLPRNGADDSAGQSLQQ